MMIEDIIVLFGISNIKAYRFIIEFLQNQETRGLVSVESHWPKKCIQIC